MKRRGVGRRGSERHALATRRRLAVQLLWGAALAVAVADLTLPLRAHAQALHIEITDQGFSPTVISGSLNAPVRIDIHNGGSKRHNFILPAFYIYTPNLAANASTWVEFTPDKRGTYGFFSDTGGKPEPGLAGHIFVK